MRRRIKHVHFVGVGGIGMSGLAELLHNQGYRTSGSDLREGPALERLRSLFAALEAKEQLLKLVEAAEVAEGVQIFIGAESDLFGLAGCSAVISPYRDSQRRLIGAIGVIGPSRINYARIIPMVDYTAKVIGRILG